MTEDIQKVDLFKVSYDQNHILSKRQDVILEAKRVILNEQLDKIRNITLTELENSRKSIDNCVRQCKDNLDLKTELFWKNVPNPKKTVAKLKEVTEDEVRVEFVDIVSNLKQLNIEVKSQACETKVDNNIAKKFFSLWREAANAKKETLAALDNKLDQREKLDTFIRKIKKCRKQKALVESDAEKPKPQVTPKPSSNFKNRFNAQKNIIDMQKTKLEQQNKLIEELKLGIIREDLLKSIENTKTNIREIFGDCSQKLKYKVPVIFLEEKQKFMVSTQKAPKVVQQMEERALERARNRQIILERKRLIEEARQRMLEQAIENKRVLEEEEKKQNLESIKERRKKELELEKIRQANKQRLLQLLNKAIIFHNRLLTRRYFKGLYDNFRKGRKNSLVARKYYETKILKKVICCWCDFIEDKYKLKYAIADAQFTFKTLKQTMKTWHNFYVEGVRNMQVAEDLYDFRLTSNSFIHWNRYTCQQFILQDRHMKVAQRHYHRRLLFHYFYQWRSLPAVNQLEKAKELKKRKWREKVWEILPDYKPPEDI